MKVPVLPSGWWLAYIYPHNFDGERYWIVDARSIIHRVAARAEELEEAIEMAIAKIEQGEDWEEDTVRKVVETVLSLGDLASMIGLGPKDVKRRKV